MQTKCVDKRLPDAAWEAHRKLLSAWGKHSPKTAAPKIAIATQEYMFGWQARGSGYANTVTEDGWRLFRKHVENGRVMLAKLEKEAINEPEWYAVMLQIGLSQQWEQEKFEAMFSRATGKFPYYLPYYNTKSNYYSAKWGGSQVAFKGFVDDTVKATQEKMGQTMYARLNWATRNDNLFANGQADWKRMKQGFEDMLKTHNDDWNRNSYARFACMAGDTQTLRAQYQLVIKNFMPEAWRGMEVKCRRMIGDAVRAEQAAGRT